MFATGNLWHLNASINSGSRVEDNRCGIFNSDEAAGVLRGSASKPIERSDPPMSQCWEQLVHKLRALTATAWSPLVFNPDAETVRMLPSGAPGRVSRNLKYKDT